MWILVSQKLFQSVEEQVGASFCILISLPDSKQKSSQISIVESRQEHDVVLVGLPSKRRHLMFGMNSSILMTSSLLRKSDQEAPQGTSAPLFCPERMSTFEEHRSGASQQASLVSVTPTHRYQTQATEQSCASNHSPLTHMRHVDS